MARRRKQSTNYGGLVALVTLLLAVAAVASYPWLLVFPVLAGAAWVYWRWIRPRKGAKVEAERQVRAEHARREELRVRSQSLGGLLTLTPREFEQRVAAILEQHGYDDVEHVGRSGDLGIDLYATTPDGHRVGVQCKRYALEKLVRAPEVRLLYGDMTHAGVGGLFVTTSGYTADATVYAESHGIRLIDGKRLTSLLTAMEPVLDPRDRDSI